MSAQENKAIIRQWIEHWNTRNLQAWIDTVDPHCTFPVLAASGASPTFDCYKQFCLALLDAFPDWNDTIERIVAEDDVVMTRVTEQGTQRGDSGISPATDKPITITTMGI